MTRMINLPSSLYDNPCIGECRATMCSLDNKNRCHCGRSEKVIRDWGKLSRPRKAQVVMGAWNSKGKYMPRQKLEFLQDKTGRDFYELRHSWLKFRGLND